MRSFRFAPDASSEGSQAGGSHETHALNQEVAQDTSSDYLHRCGEAHQRHEAVGDTEAGMLSGVSRKRRMRSNPCWFTEFCKSQCLSHFAAPFIVV